MSVLVAGADRRVVVMQGEYQISGRPDIVLSTLLGSCVAMCLHDPVARLGGMNHFLLPGPGIAPDGASLRYGAHAMDLLIDGLLAQGAQRDRLQARLFGGARMLRGMTDLGSYNAGFAEDYLARAGVAVVGGDLRGDRGRRVEFWPYNGRTRQRLLAPEPGDPALAELV